MSDIELLSNSARVLKENEITLNIIIQKVDVSVSYPQVDIIILVRITAIYRIGMVTHHGALLESSALGAMEGYATTVSVA